MRAVSDSFAEMVADLAANSSNGRAIATAGEGFVVDWLLQMPSAGPKPPAHVDHTVRALTALLQQEGESQPNPLVETFP